MSTGRDNYELDYLNYNYLLYFNRFCFELAYIPNDPYTIQKRLNGESWDGFVLSGENDVQVAFFTADKNEMMSYRREYCESKIVNFGIKHNLPILGICRGLHFINLFFKGSLGIVQSRGHVNCDHEVLFCNEGLKFPKQQLGFVNSFHNYGVLKRDLGRELCFFAVSQDDVVEGLFHVSHRIIAVQWHPERRSVYSSIDDDLIVNHFNI